MSNEHINIGDLPQELNKGKLGKIVAEDIEALVQTEEDIKNWIQKFLTPEWYEIETTRIQRFAELSELIEDFDKDPFLPQKKIKMSFMDISGAAKPFSQRSYMDDPEYVVETKMVEEDEPTVDKKLVIESIQRIVTKYHHRLKIMLEECRVELSNKPLKANNTSKLMKQMKNFNKYWTYLNFLRAAYENILKTTGNFRYSPTIRLLHQTVYLEVREIDFQHYMRKKMFLFKKRVNFG